MTLIPSTAGGLALAALVLCSAAQAASIPERPGGIAPARPGDVAVREEFEAARRAGTREAYDLFIARHPDHTLADRARRERDQLPERKRSRERVRHRAAAACQIRNTCGLAAPPSLTTP